MKVFITGASGFIGEAIWHGLENSDHDCYKISRKKKRPDLKRYHWDLNENQVDDEVLQAEALVHLAGAPISKKWTETHKKALFESRVESLNLLFEKFKSAKKAPKILVSASGVNYYGTETSRHVFQETDPAGKDYLAQLCVDWETAADQFKTLGTRVVKLRTGIVLGEEGALLKMKPIFKWGLGSAVGSGKQIMPWISIEDIARVYIWAVENEQAAGSYNAISNNASNHELSKLLAKALGRPFFMPNVPSFALKVIFGEMASILLKGSAMSNQKLLAEGFSFKDENLLKTLKKYV